MEGLFDAEFTCALCEKTFEDKQSTGIGVPGTQDAGFWPMANGVIQGLILPLKLLGGNQEKVQCDTRASILNV